MPGVYSEILMAATLARERLDLLHSTSPVYRVPLSYRGRVVTTYYDLAIFRLPELFPKFSVATTKAYYKYMARKTDHIIAVSDSTKKDIVELLAFPEKRITRVYNGIDSRFFSDVKYDREVFLKKYEIRGRYFLFLGTLEPRKNLPRVMEAFSIFKKSLQEKNGQSLSGGTFPYQLLIVGKRGWLSDVYRQMAIDLGIDKETVFTGYVSGDDLKPLYENAEIFVMPSLYEGFGQTIVEAMACRTPVLAGNVSSIPEVTGGSALLVDPHDTEGIANAIQNLVESDELRKTLAEKGFERAKNFSWSKTAAETLEVYKKAGA